ncbi:MAG: type VI secretion system tube protein Hcp [Chloroflexi bacterium]|nr:MAG: type VI secretion system tube protein Hcp [Chloroflexota bacterium]
MTSPFVLPRTRVVAIAVAAALLALVAWQLGAARPANNAGAAVGGVHISLTVNGAKTGLFKGDDNSTSRTPGVITVLAYQYELQVPTSSTGGGGGGAVGKAIHKPVTITHLLGGSSPEFLFAAATGENLTKVQIDFFRTDKSGKDFNYYRVILTNALITDVKQYSAGDNVREDVSFEFRKIEQRSFAQNTDFIADLSNAGA